METLLKDYCKEVNIPLFGYMPVQQLDDIRPVVEQRESKGHLTGFEPALSTAFNPLRQMEACKSLIAIGIPYEMQNHFVRETTAGCTTAMGIISNMAWEYDYHRVLHERMEALKNRLLSAYPAARVEQFTDTGPLLDREIAVRCGLGRYGRNQFLINDRWGTATYLGYLLTDIPLTNEQTVTEREQKGTRVHDLHSACTDCHACQKACPTGALHGEREFDGQRCLSSLTQMRRMLTYLEREKMGLRLYGCDQCQFACPVNRKTADVPGAYRRMTVNTIDPFSLLELSNKGFKRAYGHMGFAWRGAATLKRNALIVIGNRRRREDFERLQTYMEGMNETLQIYAAWAMVRIRKEEALAWLQARQLIDETEWTALADYYKE